MDARAIDDELCIFGAGLLVDRPDVTDAAGYVALLRETSGAEFAAIVLADNLRDPEQRDDVAAARAGDAEAAQRILAYWPEQKHPWLAGLFGDPDALVAAVADRMAAWLPRYQEIEPRVRQIIERDVALRANERATLGHADLIERTTNGIRWLSEPGVRRVVLAPSYLVRPYNFTFTGGDWRIFVYPVPTRPSSRTTPSPRPRACCACTVPSATTPDSGSSASCATVTGTSRRSPSAWSCPSRRSSTTSRSSGPRASSR